MVERWTLHGNGNQRHSDGAVPFDVNCGRLGRFGLADYSGGCFLGQQRAFAMDKTVVKPRTKVKTKTQRPPLYKVILLNDDYTPREFVVQVLKAVFRMNEDQAYRVMMTAHLKGACVIAVYTRDVAETKAKEATELGKQKGYPLFFTTEPEE
jgi:ATP-dependent Clp protease adaptor protein ClpS